MKKVGILTINNYNNYGNRLQNYAVQEILKSCGVDVETILNIEGYYSDSYISKIKYNLKKYAKRLSLKPYHVRYNNFVEFSRNIKVSKIKIDNNHIDKLLNSSYDYFITGSDQVWNPYFNRMSDIDLLKFADPQKRIAYSASFGISSLPVESRKKFLNEISKFKAISVREDSAKKIISSLNNDLNVEVLIDPTMMLTAEQWKKLAKKPKILNTDRYILNYFLGNLSEERKKEINRIARENNCEVINILDKKSQFYKTGPSEFLYLEKNAFLICTDSFHSSVFAVLFNRPFVIFDRDDDSKNMNSRIETLLTKFKLKNRKFTRKITKENLEHDYTEAYKILEKERRKSIAFLEKALDLK